MNTLLHVKVCANLLSENSSHSCNLFSQLEKIVAAALATEYDERAADRGHPEAALKQKTHDVL
jgi:hypothetical protein